MLGNIAADDAHALSWCGVHGRGAALTHLVRSDRVFVAVSLSKAFGAVGGAIAFPTTEARDRVRRCGGPMIFSGPIAPAGLGAGVASALLHLTPEFEALQAELRQRTTIARKALGDAGLPLATEDDTPIMVLHYDSAQAARAVVAGLRRRGFFACVSTFPAVPINKPSVRFTVSRHNSLADVRAMVQNLVQVSMEVAPSIASDDAPLAVTSS